MTSSKTKDRIEYFVACVTKFADAFLPTLNLKRFAPMVSTDFAMFVMANRQARTMAADHNHDNR